MGVGCVRVGEGSVGLGVGWVGWVQGLLGWVKGVWVGYAVCRVGCGGELGAGVSAGSGRWVAGRSP